MGAMDKLPEQLLDLATQNGAEAAEVLQYQSFSQPVIFETNRLKQLETSESEGIALQVWYQGRPGLVVAYGPVDPTALVQKALALSDLNPLGVIARKAGQLQVFPDRGNSFSPPVLIDWGNEIIDLIRTTYPEVLCDGELACTLETSRLVTSTGLDFRRQDTTVSADFSAEWIRGNDFLSIWAGETARSNITPQTLATPIQQRLSWAQNTVKPPAHPVPVILTNKAADLLWGTVQAATNGKRFWEESTPWLNCQGTQIANSSLTMVQDPTQGPYSCPFDDEGEMTQHLTLIKAGILEGIYCDRNVGQALSRKSTGNGFRPDLGSYPTPALVNTLIQPGSRSLPDIIADLEDAIVIDQILGGGADITGDFSVNLDLGYRIRQGEIVGRLKDTMVAGNVYTLLHQIEEIANDATWNGDCHTPSLLVSGLSITG